MHNVLGQGWNLKVLLRNSPTEPCTLRILLATKDTYGGISYFMGTSLVILGGKVMWIVMYIFPHILVSLSNVSQQLPNFITLYNILR